MSLFSSNDEAASTERSGPPTPDQINLVGDGTVFEGTVRAESDVRISGRIDGRLDVKGKAIIAESGVVEGEIDATSADIAGSVDGDVYVEEQLVLKSTARVEGTIQTERLVVEEGARFTGECNMGAISSLSASVQETSASNGIAETKASSTEEPAEHSDVDS